MRLFGNRVRFKHQWGRKRSREVITYMQNHLAFPMSMTVLENNLVNKLININGASRTYRLALSKFLLSAVKIKVHIQAFHELCDGVLVGVRLLKKTEEKMDDISHITAHIYSEWICTWMYLSIIIDLEWYFLPSKPINMSKMKGSEQCVEQMNLDGICNTGFGSSLNINTMNVWETMRVIWADRWMHWARC